MYKADSIIVGDGGVHGHRSLEGTFLGGSVITRRVTGKGIPAKSLLDTI